jgi:hypothetical protein
MTSDDVQGVVPGDDLAHVPYEPIVAFVVLLTPEGRWLADSSLQEIAAKVVPLRDADMSDIAIGCAAVATEANYLRMMQPLQEQMRRLPDEMILKQMAMARQAQQAMADQQLAGKLFGPNGPLTGTDRTESRR